MAYIKENITVCFWCQAIHKKFLKRFDTSFEIKIMVKIYAIEIISKSHKPFQSYLLGGKAYPATVAIDRILSVKNARALVSMVFT